MAPILQKYFVYDPSLSAGDELGGLRVMAGDDGLHVLGSPMMVKYWIDQRMVGTDPLSKLGGAAKALLAQVTRGRSESEDEPVPVPKYAKSQAGAPLFAGTLPRSRKVSSSGVKKTAKPKKAEAKVVPPVAPV